MYTQSRKPHAPHLGRGGSADGLSLCCRYWVRTLKNTEGHSWTLKDAAMPLDCYTWTTSIHTVATWSPRARRLAPPAPAATSTSALWRTIPPTVVPFGASAACFVAACTTTNSVMTPTLGTLPVDRVAALNALAESHAKDINIVNIVADFRRAQATQPPRTMRDLDHAQLLVHDALPSGDHAA